MVHSSHFNKTEHNNFLLHLPFLKIKNMKYFFTLALSILIFTQSQAAVITIAAARTSSTGATVTIRGIVSNGAEFGSSLRYIQDGTAGVALYGSTLSSVNRGDSIEVTGTISPYQNLMEIAVTSKTIISTGNTIHPPVVLTIPTAYIEQYEGQLVQVNTVNFTSTGTFNANATTYISDGSNTGDVRLNSGYAGNLLGTIIPTGTIGLVGIMGQFMTTYQLQPRDLSDIIQVGNPPILTSILQQTNILTTGFTVGFTTQNPGNTIIQYGLTTALGSEVTDATLTTNHAVNLTGLTPATLYYVKGITISSGGDTSFSYIQVMGTQSLSSQTITCYFNRPTDSSLASSPNNYAHYLNNISADTLKAYIGRATSTIDFAIYNLDNNNGIVDALNLAATNGVTVRVVCDEGVSTSVYNSFIGSIQKVKSPVNNLPYGIMHDKFLIIDANSTNPNAPIVWTGSMNLTDDQMNIDAQNIIIFQDQTMARGYTLEFNEMLIGNKFGPDKTDNTPHEYVLQGNRVEQYFSPSDGVNTKIKNALLTANTSVHFILYSFTRTEQAYVIADNYQAHPGYFAQGIMQDTAASTSVYNALVSDMTTSNLKIHQFSWLMHHKYAIIDADDNFSDPQVITGSCNWSSAGFSKNDENDVIVHSANIANQYLQEFAQRFKDEGGVVMVGVNDEITDSHFELTAYPNPTSDFIWVNFYSENQSNTVIELLNMEGKIILSFNQGSSIGNQSVKINTSELSSGLYFLKVSSGNFSKTDKISIIK